MARNTIKLTTFALSGGCGAKLALGELDQVLSSLKGVCQERVVVGFDTKDDAGVVRIGRGKGLVHTIDVITPIVDEPEAYGRVAAANAISDVYAMGGDPTSAVSFLGVPKELPRAVLGPILRGAEAVMLAADTPLVGGHTVKDAELKLGFAVTGVVELSRLITNTAARVGDRLLLTKRLGAGVLYQALKRGLRTPAQTRAVIGSMATLNRAAKDAAVSAGVRAGTDVTGFGLAGHALNIARGSGVDLVLAADRLPALPGVLEYLRAGVFPGTIANNLAGYKKGLFVGPGVEEALVGLAADPQTSGGLLLAVRPGRVDWIQSRIMAFEIGEVRAKKGRVGRVELVPSLA